jgi:hypothetical protein
LWRIYSDYCNLDYYYAPRIGLIISKWRQYHEHQCSLAHPTTLKLRLQLRLQASSFTASVLGGGGSWEGLRVRGFASCERKRVKVAPPASGDPEFEPRTRPRRFEVQIRPCGACPLVWLRVSKVDTCVDIGVLSVSLWHSLEISDCWGPLCSRVVDARIWVFPM